ncbi:thiol-disulfide oxidoreductase DCC family protein [Brevibacillus brevis]|uniref:Thiol-disulfide oxidoreductase DCC family protein n=1 Tax=Brevibacillus brevis TaxID=1393 RepID=A0ABY9TAQ9_BREBE|nr:thiol-disulfide oxidoreductase DCC family protein [Brevibacillus brevis]WNC16954.1 thiol-disulfide oxidoreductase DCC family protein [Brevibacillus brevis]
MPTSQQPGHTASILLFDGVCHFCNGAVQFILRRDPHGRIHFASLQSAKGQELLSAFQYEGNLQSVVLIENGKLYTKSDAILRVGRKLNGAWPFLATAARMLPRSLRDPIYDWIARNRYRWWGQAKQCMLPTPEARARFLE